MATLDITAFTPALKQHYTNDRVEMMVYKDNPLFALMPKYEKFGGVNLPIPIQYATTNGRSASFSTAQTNKTASKFKAFTLTRVSDYSLASIQNEVIEASMGNSEAFLEAATNEIDSAFMSASRSIATAMFRNGSGSIGQVANSSYATTTLTLGNSTANDPTSVVNFEVGMTLVVCPNDSSTSLRTGTLVVSGIDRVNGTLTCSGNLSAGVSAIAQNDYIFVQGDPSAKLSGLDAWLPSTVAATAFFGVDRTADSTRLGGISYDASAQNIEEGLLDAANLVAREGGRPDHCFVSFQNYSNLEKALGSKVQYVNAPASPDIGFEGIKIHGPKGEIKVIPDQNCQSSVAWMLQLDTWKLYSLGKAPKILEADGLKMLRDSSADSVEVRIGAYLQMGCRAPGWNARVKLS
jgi:hypothetical protein